MAGIATIEDFLKIETEVKAGQLKPIYLLHGEEIWFIERLTQLFEESVIPEAERSFNQTICYGRELGAKDLQSIVRRYPMMGNKQLVVVKEAKQFEEWENMLGYLESPLESTILVVAFKGAKMDSRTKVYKALSKFKVYHAEKLRDYQVKPWIPRYCELKGKTIDPTAAAILFDLLGADLTAIHNEIDKMCITVKEPMIRKHHVEENVGFNREYNVFELQNALGLKDFNRSVQIAHQMGKSSDKGELLRTVPTLHGYFSKIVQVHYNQSKSDNELGGLLGVSPFFVKDYRMAVRNYSMTNLENALGQIKYLDLRLKGVNRGNATDRDLLVETVVNILKN
jgi:DNA polymerase-3 subunit delta